MRKPLTFILFLVTSAVFGQIKVSGLYVGCPEGNPWKVRLRLNKDSTYNLVLDGNSCWAMEYYEGKYHIEKDSLVLEYKTFYKEPLCRIIDTFQRPRNLNLLFHSDKNGIPDDILTIELNHDTTNVGYFPLDYIDTAIVRQHSTSITHTYYAPFFTEESRSVQFYKPAVKLKQTYYFKLKVEHNALVPGVKFRQFFKPVDRLLRQ